MSARLHVMATRGLFRHASSRPVVSLDPWAKSGGLRPPLLQLSEEFVGEGSGLTTRQDGSELLLEVFGRLIAQDGHVPDTIEVEAEGREFAVRGSKEEILDPVVGAARRLLAAEASDAQISGLGWVLRRWHGSCLRPDW